MCAGPVFSLVFLSQSCSVFLNCDISTVTVLIRGSRELPWCFGVWQFVCTAKRTCIIPSSCVALSLDSHTNRSSTSRRPNPGGRRLLLVVHRDVLCACHLWLFHHCRRALCAVMDGQCQLQGDRQSSTSRRSRHRAAARVTRSARYKATVVVDLIE